MHGDAALSLFHDVTAQANAGRERESRTCEQHLVRVQRGMKIFWFWHREIIEKTTTARVSEWVCALQHYRRIQINSRSISTTVMNAFQAIDLLRCFKRPQLDLVLFLCLSPSFTNFISIWNFKWIHKLQFRDTVRWLNMAIPSIWYERERERETK